VTRHMFKEQGLLGFELYQHVSLENNVINIASRVFHPWILAPRFPLPRFQRPPLISPVICCYHMQLGGFRHVQQSACSAEQGAPKRGPQSRECRTAARHIRRVAKYGNLFTEQGPMGLKSGLDLKTCSVTFRKWHEI